MISVFTATHDTQFLADAYQSILAAGSCVDWEWVIVFNNGAKPIDFGNPRVRAIVMRDAPPHVGVLKGIACDNCRGDILLELDHDDMLLPGTLAVVERAFEENPQAGFVYSNCVRVTADYAPAPRYAEGHGWEYRPFQWEGRMLEEVVSFPPLPSTIARIWYAPDHLRAFRAMAYHAAGGYAPMQVLDDLDLMCRLAKITGFHHIDMPLYLYRIHGENTWLKHNAEIQAGVQGLYAKHIEDISHSWAVRNDLRRVELGGRMAARPGLETVDLKDADIIADLNGPWPFEDGSVGMVRAYDVFEHLRDPLHTMKELYRVLAPGGMAFIQVPSTDGRGAFQDPTHVSWWNENSFLYYTHARWAKYIDTPVRFQSIHCATTPKDDMGVCWVQAHLMKLTEGRVPGPINI